MAPRAGPPQKQSLVVGFLDGVTGSGSHARVLDNEDRYAKTRGGSGFIVILKINALSSSQQLQNRAGRMGDRSP